MLRHVSITKKGFLVVALPLALSLAALVTVYVIGGSLERMLRWTLHSQEVLSALDEVGTGLVAIQGENLQLALLGTGESTFEIRDRAEAVVTAVARVSVLVLDNPQQSALADQLRQDTVGMLESLTNAHARLREGNRAESAALVASDDRGLRAVSALVGEMRAQERRLGVSRLELAGQISHQRRVVSLVGGLSIAIFVVLFGWSLLRSMLHRLLVIQDNVQRFAGNLDLTQPILARDEIGHIDRAVHEMVGTLRAQRRDNEMFIYSVSHDLRSPLVNLQGFSKELARSTQELREILAAAEVSDDTRRGVQRITEEQMPEALHYIDLAVQRQARIIESLLSLSRAGRVEYRWTDVDLDACVRDLVAQARRRTDTSAVDIQVANLPSVYGDPDALERLFDNLIVNAIHYLAPERPGRIEIGCEPAAAGLVVLFVRDNGVGIAKENLERVFLPFSRLGGGHGEGIGLSLVRRVVERHHGKVWIESEPGVGTTVFVTLRPAARQPVGTAS